VLCILAMSSNGYYTQSFLADTQYIIIIIIIIISLVCCLI